MSLAWHTARLTAYAPQKSNAFVRLQDLLHSDNPKTQRNQTGDEQMAVFKSFMANRPKR